ncbi:translocation and assembly module lipoprotein TamL [Pedobacter insulae]|uniref:Outer membrane protein assembly factor BamA n=1 Tax=Pedobacter insulae TaxID=414048 RepID=A0A1I2WNM1_9SPHI|nr:BamA/TamA family outer membrane protein [Pedobacter insulae]SFH01956.1 Outer membrane protein assembly factor BamA [Pedobacter insulae]
MKAYKLNDKQQVQILTILLFILVFIAGCSSTKYIEDYQAIVTKVKIDSIDKQFEEQAYNYVQKDIRPSGTIGLNVGIYNIFNTKDGKYKTNNIKPLGSPPPILDSALVEISRNQIEKFLKSKGYFNAKVKSELSVLNKKAKLRFVADPGPAFFINKVGYRIPDEQVKTLYLSQKDTFTHLHEGMRYDEDSLALEREQIYQLMRQNGYRYFERPHVRFEPDSTQHNSKVSVDLLIDDPIDGTKHKVYTIDSTNIIIAENSEGFSDSERLADSLRNKKAIRGIRFIDLSGRFRRNPIVRYDFLKSGEIYDIRKENLTYDRMYQLNVFKNVKIDYTLAKDSTNKINPVILLIPQKRMSNRIEGEVPFNNGTVGFTLSNTYTNNNFLKGAERFQFQVKGGLQARRTENKSIFNDIYQRDFSVSASLSVARLMIPFVNIPMMGKNGMPYTTFSTSYLYALQKDITVRRIFINSVTYDWVETKSKLHSFTPLNVEYRFGSILIDTLDKTDIDKYNSNKKLLESNFYNIKLLGRKDFTLGMKYAYTLNGDKLLQNRSFVYFRGNIDIAGNLLQLSTSAFGDKHDPKKGDFGKIFGLPFNQYVRPEVDLRWYKSLGGDRQFIARVNTGIGYAYGNSTAMPFEKLFYAGGSSGVRAWQARTLGPGNYNREVITDSIARSASFGIDQLGQMRIETNFEYRYLLMNKLFGAKLKGAAFLDMGNIWNISAGNPQPETYFKLDQLGKQIAIGTGIGFRYDVEFFVFRFDLGLKIKDPQFVGSEQWVINKFFNGGKEFKRRYQNSHNPDVYRFMQYNFGIGFPF